MVRGWEAIERHLWIVASAYALVALATVDRCLKRFREQATALLKKTAVLGRRLTIGKIAEAIGPDFDKHKRAWKSARLTQFVGIGGCSP